MNITVLSVFNHFILGGWCDVSYNFVIAWKKRSGPFSFSTACNNVQLHIQQQINCTHWQMCSAVMLHIVCFHGTGILQQSETRPEGLLLCFFYFLWLTSGNTYVFPGGPQEQKLKYNIFCFPGRINSCKHRETQGIVYMYVLLIYIGINVYRSEARYFYDAKESWTATGLRYLEHIGSIFAEISAEVETYFLDARGSVQHSTIRAS